MRLPHLHRGVWLGGAVVLAVCLLAAGSLLLAPWVEAGWLWLGSGPRLSDQVAERLQAPNDTAAYASDSSAALAADHQALTDGVVRWQIVSVQAANLFPLWHSALDDDPVYTLAVDLDVEYSSGRQAQMRWTTWGYGLVFGPAVLSYGSGPAGELARLPTTAAP